MRVMGLPCSACSHPDHEALDRELAHGQASRRALGIKYGMSSSAVSRHWDHVRARAGRVVLARAERVGRGSPAQEGQGFAAQVHAGIAQVLAGHGLAQEVGKLRARADALASTAEANGDARTALLAIRELTRLLELQGRMILDASAGRASDVSSHPVWMTLAGLIMGCVGPCERCKPLVLQAIRERLGVAEGDPGG